MSSIKPGPRAPRSGAADSNKLEQVVAEARRAREVRERDYREQSLRIHPWVCARCGREFTRANLQELTVHHKDHNHDNNPPDGSNWENLCIYCHENEHARYVDYSAGAGRGEDRRQSEAATHRPFASLKDLLGGSEE
jgi:5-methylcytosine-specific restriction endonuclease McrA